MNIARVNRAENYALPISVVQKSVQNILKKHSPAGKIAQENTGTSYFPGTEEAVRLPFLFPCVASGETGRIHMPGTSAASGTVLGFTVGS